MANTKTPDRLFDLERFNYSIRRFIDHLPGNRKMVLVDDLRQTTASDVDVFAPMAHQSGLAPATINGTLSALRKLFAFLIEEGQMNQQPVIWRRHRLIVAKTLPKPMAEADVVMFFQVIDDVPHRLLFLLMLRCGLRVSEACTLTWEQIDMEAGTIRINDGKGHVDRVVYLSPDVEHDLKRWRGCPIARSKRHIYGP